MTERAQNTKDTDLSGTLEHGTIADETKAGTLSDDVQAGSFNMSKRINSTTYEVVVYFNPESGETFDDKILRLVRGATMSENDGHG